MYRKLTNQSPYRFRWYFYLAHRKPLLSIPSDVRMKKEEKEINLPYHTSPQLINWNIGSVQLTLHLGPIFSSVFSGFSAFPLLTDWIRPNPHNYLFNCDMWNYATTQFLTSTPAVSCTLYVSFAGKRTQEVICVCLCLGLMLLDLYLVIRHFRVDKLGTVIVAGLAGILTADFGSGLVHWAADTWFSVDVPILGKVGPQTVHQILSGPLLLMILCIPCRTFYGLSGNTTSIPRL